MITPSFLGSKRIIIIKRYWFLLLFLQEKFVVKMILTSSVKTSETIYENVQKGCSHWVFSQTYIFSNASSDCTAILFKFELFAHLKLWVNMSRYSSSFYKNIWFTLWISFLKLQINMYHQSLTFIKWHFTHWVVCKSLEGASSQKQSPWGILKNCFLKSFLINWKHLWHSGFRCDADCRPVMQ